MNSYHSVTKRLLGEHLTRSVRQITELQRDQS